jgi:hypothetical protein
MTDKQRAEEYQIASKVMEPYLKVYMDQMAPLKINWKDDVAREQEDLYDRQHHNIFVCMLLLVLFPIGCIYVIWYGYYWTERRYKRLGY